jgi:hypothetical protein
MRRIILCAGILVMLSYSAEAQTKTKKTTTNKTNTTTLVNTSTNAAKAPAIPKSSLGWRNTPVMSSNWQIADPIVRTLNERANGASTTIDFKDFMGVGRGTYGVANGHILLRPNGATTSGGITGSGAVGTGSTPGGIGIHGASLGVNGKNPYAGPAMWGTTGTGIGTNYQMTEASSNSIRTKKKD